MPVYALALDLKEDPALIAAYERYHEKIPAAIEASIREAGITDMRIYRAHNRLFMWMETTADFSFEQKGASDRDNPAVQEWERLMDQFQQRLPWAKPGEKWVLMESIFQL